MQGYSFYLFNFLKNGGISSSSIIGFVDLFEIIDFGTTENFDDGWRIFYTQDFSNLDVSNMYNPLFIYGPSGVGKTHLLYAITNRILERYPDKKIVLISSEEFTNQLVDAIQKKTTSQFRDKLPSWYSDLSSEAKDRIDDIYDRLKEYFKTNSLNGLYSSWKRCRARLAHGNDDISA